MKYFLRYGLLASFLIGAGCASRDNYDQAMQALVGKDRDHLVATLGRPASEYTLDGDHYMIYQQADIGLAGAPPIVTGQNDGGVFHEGAEGQTYYKKWCQTTFILRGKIITGYQAKGNNCRL